MAGLSRFVGVLRLFGEDKSDWTVQEIAGAIEVPASTVYRTVRELVANGFLEPSTEAHYRLGAAFLEFDRLVRLTDPLLLSGGDLLRMLVHEARIPCVAMLARLYGERVICAAEEHGDGAEIATSYERGRPMPLTRGATSKAILAQLPARRLKKLLATGDGPAGQDFQELKDELAAIRRRGFAVAAGEVDEGLVGIAVPVASPELAISASLSLVLRRSDLDDATERRLALLLVSAGTMLTESLRAG